MEYPFHVHDIQISDPFVLADPVTGKYYLYAAHFNLDRFPIRSAGACSTRWSLRIW